MKKNDCVKLKIDSLTSEGNGVGRFENMAVFVPFTAPGDVINCRIVKLMKSYAYGIVESFLEKSSDRTDDECDVYGKCGGCSLRHITYASELEAKKTIVKDAFTRLGKFEISDLKITGSEKTEEYRNKAQYPVSEENGKCVCGFFAKRSHRVVPMLNCMLQPKIFSKICQDILDYHNENKIPAYNEQTGKGILRHIYIRKAEHTDEMMVCLVVSKDIKESYEKLGDLLTTKYENIKSFLININRDNTNVILGNKNIIIKGNPVIFDTMCGNKVEISPLSFYQVNTLAAERLYEKAGEFASLKGGLLVDLYCGAGTIGLSMVKNASKLIGVEVIAPAVENAKRNASYNNIKNAEFICKDAGEASSELLKRRITPEVVVLDPPRKGCDELTLNSVVKMNPEKIVMISCNPSTAARDAAFLREKGYELKNLEAFDLFPRTYHVETVVLMSRVDR